jgi:hypothetical protein
MAAAAAAVRTDHQEQQQLRQRCGFGPRKQPSGSFCQHL